MILPILQAWSLFQAGMSMEVVDETLDKYSLDEAIVCIQLGLLCCQASVADRPDMNSVHLMLSSDSFTLPSPGKPGIHGRVYHSTTTTTTSAFTNNTNGSSTLGGANKVSTSDSIIEYSRNSMSYSSIDEGR